MICSLWTKLREFPELYGDIDNFNINQLKALAKFFKIKYPAYYLRTVLKRLLLSLLKLYRFIVGTSVKIGDRYGEIVGYGDLSEMYFIYFYPTKKMPGVIERRCLWAHEIIDSLAPPLQKVFDYVHLPEDCIDRAIYHTKFCRYLSKINLLLPELEDYIYTPLLSIDF